MEELNSMTTSQINKLSKNDLLNVVKEIRRNSNPDSPNPASTATDDALLTKTDFRKILREELDVLRTELRDLKTENNSLKKVISDQQRSILNLERNFRDKNLIFLGVTEGNEADDKVKVGDIIAEVCGSVETAASVENSYRLGKFSRGKCRPIKVVLTSSKSKQEILRKAPTILKNSNQHKKVFIKPDLCEPERFERKRIYDKYLAIKNDPANKNKNVTLEKGILKVDSNEIDRYDPISSLFRA